MNISYNDLNYLADKMCNMSTLPVRIFLNGRLSSMHSLLPLKYDPLDLYISEVKSLSDTVGYYTTPDFDYYGVINSGNVKIIMGPTRQNIRNSQELTHLAFELGVSPADKNEFFQTVKSITVLPLNFLLQMLCTFNFAVNGETKNLNDFSTEQQTSEIPVSDNTGDEGPQNDVYITYSIEQEILNIVRSGNMELLNEWIQNMPAFRSGKVASGTVRQLKNTFIITTTLVTRTAIDCGLDVYDAFKHSDFYIQKCENCSEPDQISSLQLQMIRTFIEKIREVNQLGNESKLQNKVYFYILHNISNPIKTKDIADALFMSRSHLSTLFKQETGMNLNEYINTVKIKEARKLLAEDKQSITVISDYLGYSSSSHFCRTFQQQTGMTPSRFRAKIRSNS